jgi:hypothetical protein
MSHGDAIYALLPTVAGAVGCWRAWGCIGALIHSTIVPGQTIFKTPPPERDATRAQRNVTRRAEQVTRFRPPLFRIAAGAMRRNVGMAAMLQMG